MSDPAAPPLPDDLRELRLATPRLRGGDVAAWQTFLAAQGSPTGAIDAVFGPQTELGTKHWQAAGGLPATGVVEATTLDAARAAGFVPVGAPVQRAQGPDLSRHQGRVPWPAVRQGGASFAFNKATEGVGWQDPTFAENVAGARGAGILPGAYHYFLAHQDPGRQAEAFSKVAAGRGDLPPALDFESTSGVAPAEAVRRAHAFGVEVERLWEAPIIVYTYPEFWEGLLREAAFSPELLAWFGARDLWVAHYGVTSPRVPAPWSTWRFHQFDGDGGLTLPNGVDADFNVFQGDAAALRRWAVERRPPG